MRQLCLRTPVVRLATKRLQSATVLAVAAMTLLLAAALGSAAHAGAVTYDLEVILAGAPGAVTSSPAGIDCGSTCTFPFGSGEVVTLKATPGPASIFAGWQGDCSGTDSTCVLTMDAAKSVTAVFSDLDYELWLSFVDEVSADPRHPMAGLVQGDDTFIYGSTLYGGDGFCGTLFRFSECSPETLETIHEFSGPDGCLPISALEVASDHALYGITQAGGDHGDGTIFKVELGDVVGGPVTFTVLHHLDEDTDGRAANGGLVEANDGYIYGTTTGGGDYESGTLFKMHPDGDLHPGGGFMVVHQFGAAEGDGKSPTSTLIQATDGYLYGTTYSTEVAEPPGLGTVYRMDLDGNFTSLLSFEEDGDLGVAPIGGLVQTGPNTFYGTTSGIVNGSPEDTGRIFKFDTSSLPLPVVATPVHVFDGSEGLFPTGDLLLAGDGNLYGTTFAGGGDEIGGSVFRLDPDDDQLTVLHLFDGEIAGEVDPSDTGVLPWAGLMEDIFGQLWGTTGGFIIFQNAPVHPGTIFNLRADLFGIEQKEQTITFDPLDDKAVGDADFVVVATASSGLKVAFSTSGDCTNSGVWIHLTGEGTCTVTASQLGNAYYDPAPEVEQSFDIAGGPKLPATLTLSNLMQTYNGTPRSATVTTDPVGLSGVTVTYDGSTTAPTAAGSYAVVASLVNDDYEAEDETGTLEIGKATATLSLSNLSQTYNGSPKSATVTTSPLGLSGVSITYDGSATAPTNADSYAVVASLTSDNYEAENATDTLVIGKATATLTLSNLNQAADGSPKSVTVTTSPVGLTGVSVTYDGSPSPPSAPASYAVIASLLNDNYEATPKNGTLVLTSGPPAVSLSLAPTSVTGGTKSVATVTLAAPAPNGGAIVNLASAASSVASVPATVSIPKGQTKKNFNVTTFGVASSTSVDISAAYGGTTATQPLTVNSPVVLEVKVNPGTVVGGAPSTGTVKLNGPAGPGGASVTLASSMTGAAQVTSPVLVPAGQTSVNFPIATSPVGSSVTAAISATFNSATKSANLKVNAATVSALSLSPAKVKGGVSSTATVTLNGPAPAGGLLVTLTSSKTAVAASTSVTVAAGATSGSVAVTTFVVKKEEKADFTTSGGGPAKKATLTVTK